MDEISLEVYPEICCDLCNDVIHNHIDCPVCNQKYAPTESYFDLTYDDELTCSNCKTVFERISENWYYDCKVRIKLTIPSSYR